MYIPVLVIVYMSQDIRDLCTSFLYPRTSVAPGLNQSLAQLPVQQREKSIPISAWELHQDARTIPRKTLM